MNSNSSIDCRGLSCPEPVLRTARAARGLAGAGGVLEILADDDAFPADIESWCRSAGATLVTMDGDGNKGYRAVVRIAPKVAVVPSTNTAPQGSTTLDCRGKQCPEPVLALARHARSNEGVVEVLADDEAFSADVEAWCRSSGATLLHIEQEGPAVRARVRLAPRPASQRAGTPPPPAVRTLVSTVQKQVIDCRGQQCPEPVLALARHARGNPGQEVEILADDPAFSADVEAWCRSAGATEISRRQEGGALRVHLQLGHRAAPSSRQGAPSQALAPRAAEEGARANSTATAQFHLENHSPEQATAEALRVSNLGAGMVVALSLPTTTVAQEVLRAFTSAGHEILGLELQQPPKLTARLSGTGAASTGLGLRVDKNAVDCTLLVLHNDLEALLAALLVANGAAAAGMKVMIFFTFWGLNTLRGEQPNPAAPSGPTSFFQRVFKWMMPKGPRRQQLGQLNFGGIGASILGSIMKQQNVSNLPSLLESAQEQGVRFVACTMSMGVMGITKRDLHPYSNLEYAGVATFVDAAKSSKMSLVF